MNPSRAAGRGDRRRSRVLALRVAVATLVAAGGIVAVVATVDSGSASAHVAENLLADPSFESGTAAWTGTHLTRVASSGAPDGRFVARAATRDGAISIDDWPGSVTASTAGTTYRATAAVASAAPSALGKPVALVLREHRADGTEVASWSTRAQQLDAAFRTLTVTGVARRSGDYLDVYVHEDGAAPADALFADAFGLTARTPMPITNAIPDPSFERPPPPWAGARATATRIRTANAPDGTHVAQLTYSGRRPGFGFDDVAELSTTAGERYRASALLAAGNAATRGRTVQLVVREHTADGGYVSRFASAPTPAPRAGYQRVVADGRAARDGDRFDVYLRETNPVPGDALRLDAVSLAARPSTLGELAIGTDQADALGDTAPYRYVIIQENQYAHIAQIKAANPHTEVLAYFDVEAVRRHGCTPGSPAYAPHDSFAVDYCYAVEHHPQWLLHDSSGAPLQLTDYPDETAIDIGNDGFRSRWAEDAAAAARADGFDGVYLDDVNTHPGHGLDGRVAEYSDQQYGQAMVGFVDAVTRTLSAEGLLSIANVGLDPWVEWQADDAAEMAPHLSAVTKEFFSRWGSECGPFSAPFSVPGTDGSPSLRQLQDYQVGLQVAGGAVTGIDYGATPSSAQDRTAMSYGRADFLLAWNGRPGGAYLFRPCGAVDPADPDWTTELGLPTGPMRSVAGAWVRPYTEGLVILDPSATASATVPVAGSFRSQDGEQVSGEVTLAPRSALLLTRTGY